MASDDLKLFGTVGLDISTLKRDIDALQSEIQKGNKSVNELGKAFDDVGTKLNNAFKNLNVSDLAKALSAMESLSNKYTTKQINSMSKAAVEINEIEKNGLMTRAMFKEKAENEMLNQTATINKYNLIQQQIADSKIIQAKQKTDAQILNSTLESNAKISNSTAKETARIAEINTRTQNNSLKEATRVAEIKSRIINNETKQIGLAEQNKIRSINAETAAIKQQTSMYRMLEAEKKYSSSQKYNSFANRFNSLADYLLASTSIYSSISAFNKVLEINKQFEVQQVSLQRVLGGTASQMEELKNITFDLATATGNSVNDIQTIENLWIRTGVSSNDAIKKLTEVTAMGLNVAEFDSVADSVSYLNAAINQMVDGDWSQAEDILNSWAKVSDYTAVKTTKDLAEVVSRSGSYAKQLGISYNELNAMSAIISENMAKSGEEIGTAFKSIFARLQDENYYKVIESYGVQVTEVGKYGYETFRSFTDIMDDLNAKFKQLSEAEYDVAIAEITKAMGGTRQGNYFLSLIKDWDKFNEIVKISTDSVGYVTEQNNKIMGTFDKQVEQLLASLTELSVVLGEAGIMKVLSGLVTGATGVANAFNNMDARWRNVLATTAEIVVAFGVLGAVKNKVFGEQVIIRMYDAIRRLYFGTMDMQAAQVLLNQGLNDGFINSKDYADIIMFLNGNKKLETLSTEAQTAAEALQDATTTKLITKKLLLAGALKTLIAVIPLIIIGYKTWKDSQDELIRQQIESIKKQKDEVDSIDKLIRKYEALASKEELTSENKAELKNISEELYKLLPNAPSLIDAETDSYSKQLSVLKDLSIEKRKTMKDNAILYTDANRETYNKTLSKRKEIQKQINMLNDARGKADPDFIDDISKQIIKKKAEIDKLNEVIDAYEEQANLISEIRKQEMKGWGYLGLGGETKKPVTTNNDEEIDLGDIGGNSDYKKYDIDYDSIQEALKILENELSLLDKEEKLLNNIKDKSAVYDLYTRKINIHTSKISELNKQHEEYKVLLADVDSRIKNLSPTTEDYDKMLDDLNKSHYELTDKIRQTTLEIEDEKLAIDDINNSMKEMVINSLTSGLNAQKNIATKKLENKLEKDKLDLQYKYFDNLTKENYNSLMDGRIAKLKEELDLLEKQNKAQENAIRLQNILDEINSVKADTRFVYIDDNGKEAYTYDRGKVKDLEKQYQDELKKQSDEANKDLINEKINALEKEKDLNNDNYESALKNLEDNYKNQLESLNIYWEEKLKTENIKQQAMALILSLGYKNALISTNKFNDDMSALQKEQATSSYTEGKNITDSLFDGLFNDLDSYIAEYMKKLSAISGNKVPSPSPTTPSSIGGNNNSGGSSSSSGISDGYYSTATIAGVGTVPIHINSSGKTTTTGLPVGTVVTTAGGDYIITGGTGGNYTSVKKYALGGVSDFTGIAQLDGSPTSVETVFNAKDGKKLYDLVHSTDDLVNMVYNNISENVGRLVVGSPMFNLGYSSNNSSKDTKKDVVIYINSVSADNFDEFMNSISPYINAR